MNINYDYCVTVNVLGTCKMYDIINKINNRNYTQN